MFDPVILIMPCPVVWRLQMSKRRRIVLLGMLLAGAVVTLASNLRLIYLVHLGFFDPSANYYFTHYQVYMATTIEIHIAILCTCLPTLKAFVKRFFQNVFRQFDLQPEGFSHKSQRSLNPPASGLHPSKTNRNRASESGDERMLTKGPYLKLGEDGKSDQSYAMTEVEVS